MLKDPPYGLYLCGKSLTLNVIPGKMQCHIGAFPGCAIPRCFVNDKNHG